VTGLTSSQSILAYSTLKRKGEMICVSVIPGADLPDFAMCVLITLAFLGKRFSFSRKDEWENHNQLVQVELSFSMLK